VRIDVDAGEPGNDPCRRVRTGEDASPIGADRHAGGGDHHHRGTARPSTAAPVRQPMTSSANSRLRLGSNVVELLLPQKRPFLMVDFVSAFRSTPVPALESGRHVSANETFFDGHFPGMHIWPGTLTIEGLGQTSALLMSILAMRRLAE